MSRINVITALYNTPIDLFKESLHSLGDAAKDLDVKHIIVNDGSTVSYQELDSIIFYGDVETKYISLSENKGPGAARNEAFKHLDDDCEYICFLDSDDRLEIDSLEKRAFALDVAKKIKNARIIACYGDKYDLDIRTGAKKQLAIVPEFDRQRFANECFIPSNSVMFRRDMFSKYIGKMLEDVKLAEDYNLWLKLATIGDFIKINIPVYTQVMHGGNLTLNPKVLENHWINLQMCYQDLDSWRQELKTKYNV